MRGKPSDSARGFTFGAVNVNLQSGVGENRAAKL